MSVNVNNLRVQFGLGQGAQSDISAITWTDVTGSVILRDGVNFSTGKSFADRVARPGSCTFTLDNSAQKGTAGRWTIGGPNCTSGFDLRIPVQIGYWDGTVVNPLWTGFIDLASSAWEGGQRSVVRVTASDRLARLARQNIGNRYTEDILASNPAGFWPLDDAGGDRAFNRGSWSFNPLVKRSYSYFSDGDGAMILGADPVDANNAPIRFGVDQRPAVYSATSPFGNGQFLTTDVPSQWTSSSHLLDSFELFFAPTNLSGSQGLFAVAGFRDRHCGLISAYMSSGQLRISFLASPGVYFSALKGGVFSSSTSRVKANQWNHLYFTQATTVSGGTSTCSFGAYVNGNLDVSGSITFTAGWSSVTSYMMNNAQLWVGASADFDGGTSSPFTSLTYNGYLSNFAYYPAQLTQSELDTRIGLISGFNGDSSTTRFNRIAKYGKLAANSYSTSGTAQSTMSGQPMIEDGKGRNMLTMIQEIADTEVGDAVVLPSGQLQFYTRAKRWRPSSGWNVPARAINADNGFDWDQTEIINSARITSGDGTVNVSEDSSSIALYDKQPIEFTSYVNDATQLESITYGLAHRQSTPKPRLRTISIDFVTFPSGIATDAATILNSQILDVFTVTELPSATSPTSSLILCIEGYEDRITESSWSRTFTASQVSSALLNTFKLNTSTLDSSTDVLAL